MPKNLLKGWTLSLDGRGYVGQAETYSPPVLAVTTEDYRAGELDAPLAVDVGMEALEWSVVLHGQSASALQLFGLIAGQFVAASVRGALEDEVGNVTPVVHSHRAKVLRVERSEWVGGSPSKMTLTCRDEAYFETHGGVEKIGLDIPNVVRRVDGVDQLEARRAALGI